MKKITSEQVKAARSLLSWTQEDLAAKSSMSLPAIKRLEASAGPLKAQARTFTALVYAFESAGVTFIGPGDGEIGVVRRED